LDDGDGAPCVVGVFQIKINELNADFKEQGQHTREWISLDVAARRVREVELKPMLVDFRPRTGRRAKADDRDQARAEY